MSMEQLQRFMTDLEAAQNLCDRGKTQEAEALLKQAATRFPRGWAVLAQEYMDSEDYETARKLFGQVLDLTEDPRVRSSVLSNLGLIKSVDGDREGCRKCFEEALEMDPHSPIVLNNLGLSIYWDGDITSAMMYYQKSLAQDPHFALAEFHLAMCHIKIGDWKTGWRLYESRFRKLPAKLRRLATAVPEWNGKKTGHIAVIGEQGCGDTFMTIRLAEALQEFCEKQTWVVQKKTAGVCNLVDGLRAVESLDEVGPFDAHIQSMSLFHRLGITHETLPVAPYMAFPDPEGPRDRAIGIVWKGSGIHNHNRYRSSRLEEWQPILDLREAGFEIVSLQVDGPEAAHIPGLKVLEPPADWLETARRMQKLSAVVSVDTGAAHLAGAMGIPLYLMVSPSAEWRWGVERDWSVLYPSARLFRADKEQTYADALDAVARKINEDFPI